MREKARLISGALLVAVLLSVGGHGVITMQTHYPNMCKHWTPDDWEWWMYGCWAY